MAEEGLVSDIPYEIKDDTHSLEEELLRFRVKGLRPWWVVLIFKYVLSFIFHPVFLSLPRKEPVHWCIF
jgi:hypothetical protein